MEIWPNKKYSNIYGPTEVNQCTYYNFEKPPTTDAPIPIGHVWENTEFKILDTKDKEVSEGEKGLLVIRSGTMMKGYWNNSELTSTSLYKEKILDGVEKIYYRTGDLVKLNRKGELLFFGRKDRQIKIRGFRVEIDEIENTLMKFPYVKEAAVVVVEENEEKQIYSVVILNGSKDILDVKEIFSFCKKLLPVYAIPEKIVIWEKFPRTSTGKIDRKSIEKKLSISKYG